MLLEALAIPLILYAFIAMLSAGATLSLVGVIVIPLHLVTLRFTLMHVGLFGAALAIALGTNTTLTAYVLVLAVSLLMGFLTKERKEEASSVAALFMTFALGGAFLLLALVDVPAMEVFDIFAGNILLLRSIDLWGTLLLGLFIILFFIFNYRELQLILLHTDLAHVLGVPVQAIMSLIFIILGLAVATALRLVGALLVDALLFLPALAALRIAKNFLASLLLTSLFGFLTALTGFLLALYANLPIGASTAVTSSLIVLFIYTGEYIYRRNIKESHP